MGLGSKIRSFRSEIKLSLNFPKIFSEIRTVLKEKQLWKNLPRKSYARRLFENVWWFFIHKEACIYYNSYGFDIKNFRNKRDYLSYRRFRIERNIEDYPKNIYENKLFVLRNKIAFSIFFGTFLGDNKVVETLGLLDRDGMVYDFKTKEKTTKDIFFERHASNLFVKKINGECGEDCYLLQHNKNNISLLSELTGSQFIIQPLVEQHQDISNINPSCVNTIRIITIVGKKDHTPNIFAKYMRVGCNSINDNRATGGVGVAINDDGILGKYGVGHHKVETIHPVTNHVYEGTSIPFWNEVKNLVIKAHSYLLDIPTIGWDVAITKTGPILIEGNDNWEISGAQDTIGGLKKKWYAMHE